MFTSSVRRAALAAQPSPLVASLATSAPRAVSTQSLSCRPLQRRYSSSKPSNPADGPKGVPDNVSAAPAAQADAPAKKSKTSRARKAKDVAASCTVKGRDETMQNLPSVPSTGHLQIKGTFTNPSLTHSIPPAVLTSLLAEIAASAFFSLHRPISVTTPFPKPITPDAFAAIFAARAPKRHSVLSALSHTPRSVAEQPRWLGESGLLRDEAPQQDDGLTHLDALPGDAIPFPQHIMHGRYQPFNAPPAPVPMDAAAVAEADAVQHRTYTTMLTIEESTDANGEVTYVAHSGPLVDVEVEEPGTPRRFLDRMSRRQRRFEEGRREVVTWQAISVKRQRKLKMKKHKYKKLMRKTRNLRRRLDRN